MGHGLNRRATLAISATSICFLLFVFGFAYATHHPDQGSMLNPPSPPQPDQPNFSQDIGGSCRDRDDDGLCDSWERSSGLRIYSQGLTYKYLCGNYGPDDVCPNRNNPDIYLEFDWMIDHGVDAGAMNDVISYFDTTEGIKIHDQLDEAMAYHKTLISAMPIQGHPANEPPCAPGPSCDNSERNNIKRNHFGTPADRAVDALTHKRQAFHYGLIAHQQSEDPNKWGLAEILGNDFVL